MNIKTATDSQMRFILTQVCFYLYHSIAWLMLCGKVRPTVHFSCSNFVIIQLPDAFWLIRLIDYTSFYTFPLSNYGCMNNWMDKQIHTEDG